MLNKFGTENYVTWLLIHLPTRKKGHLSICTNLKYSCVVNALYSYTPLYMEKRNLFLVVLIQGFRDLSDCSQSFRVSSRQSCQFPHGFEEFGLEFPPNRRTASPTPECPAHTDRSVRPGRSVRRAHAGVSGPFLQFFPLFRLASSFVVCCLVFGDFRRNYKLPHQTALRRHRHELQAIPLTSPPLARFKGIPCNFANPSSFCVSILSRVAFLVLPRH